jgi:uncharacterized protein YggE
MNVTALAVACVTALYGATAEPGILGSGQESVKMMPDTMVMSLNLLAVDEDFDKALATVQKQMADVKAALGGLAGPPASITSEGPWQGPAGDESGYDSYMRRQMMMEMGRRMPEEEGKEKTTLSAIVEAEWKLAGADALALLKETSALQASIRAALPDLSAPEGEMSEEAEEQMMLMMDAMDELEQPGDPVFTFSAGVTPQKLAEARKAAFQKARDEAASLAQAAGVTLGGMVSISGSSVPESDDEMWRYASMMTGMAAPTETTARSATLRELSWVVAVEVVFGFSQAQ